MLLSELVKLDSRIQIDEEDLRKLAIKTAKVCETGKFIWIGNGSKGTNLHTVILGEKPGYFIDHIDQNFLNNRKENLRHCTAQQNSRNTSSHYDGTSRYKGVCWAANRGRWRVTIWDGKKQHHIGFYKDENLAALAYNRKARELFGEFACLNLIESSSPKPN